MLKKTLLGIAAATVVTVSAIASNGAEAAKLNQSQLGGAQVENVFAGKANRQCWRSHKKCYGYIDTLCRRLLKKGFGGGSMSNCRNRKALRCDTRFDCTK